jgi:hypothetical protein
MLTSTTTTSSYILDSLPYVDAVHEDYEEYALALIEEEMKQFEPRSLPRKMPPLNFRSPLMQQEYETLVQGDEYVPREPHFGLQPLKPADIKDYETDLPQAKARLEAERIRSVIVEVEKEDAAVGWKEHVQDLTSLHNQWSQLLQKQREQVEEINYQRQQAQQQQLGPQLQELELQYQQALYKRNQLQHAIIGLQRELGIDESMKGAAAAPTDMEEE